MVKTSAAISITIEMIWINLTMMLYFCFVFINICFWVFWWFHKNETSYRKYIYIVSSLLNRDYENFCGGSGLWIR